ncbi:hypothetical protein OROGR_005208 [Orobanche gracilis]
MLTSFRWVDRHGGSRDDAGRVGFPMPTSGRATRGTRDGDLEELVHSDWAEGSDNDAGA